MALVRPSAALALLTIGYVSTVSGQTAPPVASGPGTQIIEVKPAATTAFSHAVHHASLAASKEVEVSVRARLLRADGAPEHEGQLILQILSEVAISPVHDGFASAAPELNIRLVLSSAGDAYGESRQCSMSARGEPTFTFIAGLDEKNFVPFTPSKDAREFRFSLNKYFCRALAAPFHCKDSLGNTSEVKLPSNMDRWKVGVLSSVELDSKGASAKAEVSGITFKTNGKPFDYATCAAVAPSNGLCCVQHKTTEWHCGGAPTGEGWHQVSGDCYHRETGSSCSE